MTLESVVPWNMESRVRQGGMCLWKKDAATRGWEEKGAQPGWGFTHTPVERVAGFLNEGLQIKAPQTLTVEPGWVTDSLHRASEHSLTMCLWKPSSYDPPSLGLLPPPGAMSLCKLIPSLSLRLSFHLRKMKRVD